MIKEHVLVFVPLMLYQEVLMLLNVLSKPVLDNLKFSLNLKKVSLMKKLKRLPMKLKKKLKEKP
jgi:hypothetical protein